MELSYIKPGVELYDNQKDVVRFLVKRSRALIADKTGSGKTLATLYAYSHLHQKEKVDLLFVITPLSAYEKQVWVKDMKKFTNLKFIDFDTVAQRLDGGNDISFLKNFDVVYGKHSHIRSNFAAMCKVMSFARNPSADRPGSRTLLCIDEVHAFRKKESSQTKMMNLASRYAMGIWSITATALSKNLEDTYNIIELTKPGFFGNFVHFRSQFCQCQEKIIGRAPGGRVKKALQIVGIKDEEFFQAFTKNLILQGNSTVDIQFHWMDYDMNSEELRLYRKVSAGLSLNEGAMSSDWLQGILSDELIEPHYIKDVEKYSSRFIYLQTAADGVLTKSGSQDKTKSVKIDMLINLLKEKVNRGQSALVYFEYISSLDAVERRLKDEHIYAKILRSTGELVLKDGVVTEATCKRIPHIILCTRASSESASYYFINNVVMFHIPTIPSTFTQMVGRVTRKNSLFLGDLHCYIFRSDNIDLYKMLVVSSKAYQMEIVGGKEANIPDDYKIMSTDPSIIERAKKALLWGTLKNFSA